VNERTAAVRVAGVGKRFRQTRDRRSTLKELVVRGRPRQHDDFWALRGVSLDVPKGSVYGLLGHNGSGKSTLLKVVAGIYRPNEGNVEVDGRLAALIELGAGFHPDLTGRENIRLNGSILGLSRKEIAGATGEIIDFSGLGDFIDEPVKNYSSGMYVRLGFSVAVHMRPDVLLVDEVIAVGDEDFQRRCFDHLYKLRRAGGTIVIVSHATNTIAALCDEVAWLDHGRLVETGSANAVVTDYIASVNAVEASGTSNRTASEGAQRPGSGQVRLTAVEIIDEEGGPLSACVNGERLRLRLAFHADQEVTDPVFALSVRHETGAVITQVTTRATGDDVPLVAGGGRIDYVQDPCRLNPGAYRLDVSIADASGKVVHDTWTDALDLVVRAGRELPRGGLVSLPDAFDTTAAVRQAEAGPGDVAAAGSG
jgi:ABC-2 type transport system ATP-binding protein/lipopolysaccharide transport system ATP-binding protein